MLVAGSELPLRNVFSGLALVAHAIDDAGFVRLPHDQIIERAIAALDGGSVIALPNVVFPLAHEIGHLPQAQALSPRAIQSDELLETYAINYHQVHGFTGEFDYSSSLDDTGSPLSLAIIREEAASDFFGVASITNLVRQSTKVGVRFAVRFLRQSTACLS
jgi:hypothetical protein